MTQRFGLEHIKKLSGILIAIISTLSFIGWLIDYRILASYGQGFIPMSPDTAPIFIFFGLSILTNSYKSSNNIIRRITILAFAIFSLYGFLKLAQSIIPLDLTLENYVLPTTEKLGLFPLKRMSPLTGIMFFLAGIAFLIKTNYREQRKTNNIIGIIGALILFCGFAAILGYSFQTPLLYSSKIMPMSLPTAISFLFLGISILLLGGRKTFLTKHFIGKTTQTILIRTIIPILFLTILLQGLILRFFNEYESINFAFLAAILSLLFIIATSIILINVSKLVFKNAALSEAKSKQAETTIKIKDELLKLTGELAKVGGWEYNPYTKVISVTDEIAKIFELKSEKEFSAKVFYSSFDNDSRVLYENALSKLIAESIPYDLKFSIKLESETQKAIRIIGFPVTEDLELIKVRGIIQDITEEKANEKKHQLTATILSILNQPKDWSNLIDDILLEIKKFLDFEAIALRIRNGNDYPYYQSIGFPEDFIKGSKPLCSIGDDGELIRDSNGSPLLHCFCGSVISEKIDPSKPYYTINGSYWSNSSTKFLESTPDADLPYKYRNRCNLNHYESVALIPLRSNNEIIGLLQLNDKRENQFTVETISYLEEIGSLIGIAFKRIQSENQIKDSEEQFRSITQTAADAIISIDDKGKIITWNNSATTIFGYTKGEAIGNDLHKLIVSSELYTTVQHGLLNFIRNGEGPVVGKTIEVSALAKDGRTIPVELSISSFIKGTKWHATGIIRDITERKNAELAVEERVKEIQCLQSISRITDKENLTTGKFFNKVVNLVPPGFQNPERTECRIILKDQTFQTASFVESANKLSANIVSRNKTIGAIEVYYVGEKLDNSNSYFLKEEKELLITITKILGEFIERKRRELIQKIIYNSSIAVDTSESLADLVDYIKNQISLLVDTTNFFAAFYDEETDSVSLPYHHDKIEMATKFPAGKTLTKHVIKTQRPLLATKSKIEELEKLGIIELNTNRAKVWLGVPLIVKGKVTGIFAVQSYADEKAYDLDDLEIFEFISRQVSISIERKKVEQDLKAAYLKAKESDRLKSTFLATMSHELRTPLNAVIGFSEMMQSDLDSHKVNEYAGIINNSGLHLLEIIEDIFDITLLESGEVKVSKCEFNFKTLLEEVNLMLYVEQEKMDKQAIEIKYFPSQESDDLILNSDKSKLKQILINLLKNALKFTLEGNIEYGYKVEYFDDSHVIMFYVKDTGIGIRNEDIEIIFDNFRQVDDTNTRLFGGTGIGLSVAKRYTDMLGGKIWVESRYGVGSTFYLTIPLPETRIKPISPAIVIDPLKPPKYKGKTILIAEDELSNYELLIVYLEDLDVRTLWAKDGEEAVNICQTNKDIDLVLMDIKMPKMNGLDATSIIKRNRPNLPIIAQTAFVLHGDDEKAFEAGCNDYIGKPIKRKDLYSLLSKYL
jgi:PAS domain S-box-containing protein